MRFEKIITSLFPKYWNFWFSNDLTPNVSNTMELYIYTELIDIVCVRTFDRNLIIR